MSKSGGGSIWLSWREGRSSSAISSPGASSSTPQAGLYRWLMNSGEGSSEQVEQVGFCRGKEVLPKTVVNGKINHRQKRTFSSIMAPGGKKNVSEEEEEHNFFFNKS